MNPDYEFLTHQCDQMVSQSRLSIDINEGRNRESGIRGKLFRDRSVAIYSRN